MYHLILASQSPRRRELLLKLPFSFQIISIEISETLEKNINLDEQIMTLAQRKAEAVITSGKLSKSQKNLVLSADTLVILGEKILGKPENKKMAFETLTLLSGRTHSVKTGVCLWDTFSSQIIRVIETSQVTFRELSSSEIWDYIETGEPMDKAGSYGIQSPQSRGFITSVEGSVDNVMGLPVELVKQVIDKQGWNLDKREP